MVSRLLARRLVAACILLPVLAASAEAQWLLLGRKVVGRIENMVQSEDASKPQAPRYDVAVVVLDAPAARVYDKVIATVAEHPDYRYLQRNDVSRDIEVTNGQKSAGVHVVELDDQHSQLIIASVIQPGQASPVPMALQTVLSICEKAHVTCTVDEQP